MTDQDTAALAVASLPETADIGRPVEWMVDPARRDLVLGVTYTFSESGQRRTVWYTPNKRRAKSYVVVSVPREG
jgi:hypothetical protein